MADTCKLTKLSNTNASQRRGGKYADDANATPIIAPKMRDIGDNDPRPVMMGHGFNKFQDSNYIYPAAVPILKA